MTQHHHQGDEMDDHDRGLAFDLDTIMARRRALKLFVGVGHGMKVALPVPV
jgi:hypothetical protein